MLFQVSGRVITASQQKPSKTVTARIAARVDVAKAARSNLQVMGVVPPMSSVIVERHHPVTQVWDSVDHYCYYLLLSIYVLLYLYLVYLLVVHN